MVTYEMAGTQQSGDIHDSEGNYDLSCSGVPPHPCLPQVIVLHYRPLANHQ